VNSDRGKPNYFFDEEGRISEKEIEQSERSTPPGTIGESKDVMSEYIQSNKLNKKGKTFTYNPKSSTNELDKQRESGIAKPTKFEVLREKILVVNRNYSLNLNNFR